MPGVWFAETMFELLWPDTHVEDANLTNTIVALRKILGKAAVETVSKFGYRVCTTGRSRDAGDVEELLQTVDRANGLITLEFDGV